MLFRLVRPCTILLVPLLFSYHPLLLGFCPCYFFHFLRLFPFNLIEIIEVLKHCDLPNPFFPFVAELLSSTFYYFSYFPLPFAFCNIAVTPFLMCPSSIPAFLWGFNSFSHRRFFFLSPKKVTPVTNKFFINYIQLCKYYDSFFAVMLRCLRVLGRRKTNISQVPLRFFFPYVRVCVSWTASLLVQSQILSGRRGFSQEAEVRNVLEQTWSGKKGRVWGKGRVILSDVAKERAGIRTVTKRGVEEKILQKKRTSLDSPCKE